MSAMEDNAPVPALGSVQAQRFWIAGLCVAVLLAAIPWQMRWGIIPDTSWTITMCERLLAGARLYVDLFEVNPPFTPWMFMPAVALAHAVNLPPEVVMHAYAYAICLLGLGFAVFIARRAGLAENGALAPLLPLFLGLLVILPGSAFGEREHLGTALLLPLLVLMVWRATPAAGPAPGLLVAALAGLCASVMVLVKPYYAVVVLAPALYVAWRRRSIWSLFAIEYWVIGLVCVAYLVAVMRFYPQFLDVVYPILADTYMRLRVLPLLLEKYAPAYLVALGTLWLLRPGLPLSPLVTVFALASLAALVPFVYQAKGWAYHAFPTLSLMVTALVLRAMQADDSGRSPSGGAIPFRRKLLLVFALLANALPFMPSEKPGTNLVDAVRSHVEQPTVALVGSDIAAGHPLARMVGGRWISAYCSDWLGGIATYLSQREARNGNQAAAEHYRQVAGRYMETKLAELRTGKPSLIILQKQDPVWTSQLFARQDFVRFMADYHQIAEDDRVRILLRDGAGLSAGL